MDQSIRETNIYELVNPERKKQRNVPVISLVLVEGPLVLGLDLVLSSISSMNGLG